MNLQSLRYAQGQSLALLNSSFSSWEREIGCCLLAAFPPFRRVKLRSNKKWGNNIEEENKTLPEAQQTQGIDSVSWVISWVEMKRSCRDYSRCGVNTLDPLCLWQCFFFNFHLHYFQFRPPGGVICISSNVGHRIALHALVKDLANSLGFLY